MACFYLLYIALFCIARLYCSVCLYLFHATHFLVWNKIIIEKLWTDFDDFVAVGHGSRESAWIFWRDPDFFLYFGSVGVFCHYEIGGTNWHTVVFAIRFESFGRFQFCFKFYRTCRWRFRHSCRFNLKMNKKPCYSCGKNGPRGVLIFEMRIDRSRQRQRLIRLASILKRKWSR